MAKPTAGIIDVEQQRAGRTTIIRTTAILRHPSCPDAECRLRHLYQ